jgi:hypothetical protein
MWSEIQPIARIHRGFGSVMGYVGDLCRATQDPLQTLRSGTATDLAREKQGIGRRAVEEAHLRRPFKNVHMQGARNPEE